VLYSIGGALAHAERYEEALAYLSRLIEVSGENPNRHKAYGRVAMIQLQLGNRHEAMKYFEKVLEVHPEERGAHYHLAHLKYDDGACAASLRHIEAFRRAASEQYVSLLNDRQRHDLQRALEALKVLEAGIERQQ
jgi:tetratricopeptide (TPR) repeat protein